MLLVRPWFILSLALQCSATELHWTNNNTLLPNAQEQYYYSPRIHVLLMALHPSTTPTLRPPLPNLPPPSSPHPPPAIPHDLHCRLVTLVHIPPWAEASWR